MSMTFQAKHERLPSPPPKAGEGAPAGAGEGVVLYGAERRKLFPVLRNSKTNIRRFRAAWNDSLSRPCRATLSPQGGEGTASGGASSGQFFLHFQLRLRGQRVACTKSGFHGVSRQGCMDTRPYQRSSFSGSLDRIRNELHVRQAAPAPPTQSGLVSILAM
jgi:hypothetical protein